MKSYYEFVDEGCWVDEPRDMLLLGALGLNTESGEVGDVVKKHVFHGKDLDRVELIKELGDVLWYFTVILNQTGISMEEVIEANLAKLCERYPERHSDRSNYANEF